MKPPTRLMACPDCGHQMGGYSWQLVEAAVAHQTLCGGIMRRVIEPEHEPPTPILPAVVEDALWLLEQGESPHEAARRVGLSIGALEVALRRAGRPRGDVQAAVSRERRAA